MAIWSAEIKELEILYTYVKGRFSELDKEIGLLIKTDDENVVMLYSRRCLEIIITDLCEYELKRPRKTEPLKGIIDKLHHEEKVPPHIITSMQNLNSLSTFGAHPKDFDPEQVKPVLNNLTTIFKWYLKYKDTQAISKPSTEEVKTESISTEDSTEQIQKTKEKLILLLSGIALVIVIVVTALFVFDIIGGGKRIRELEKSIAVLPFKNLSEETGNEYFTDGLVEDLLNRISVIEELKVISRTSSEMFRERGVQSVPEIARQLGVSYIVEGSVQRYGDRARVTVQLIEAINDDHIWAENYDRDLVDIFKTQSDIAMNIASELNAILTSGQKTQIQENRTRNIEAFELYQMGRYYWNKRTGDGYQKSNDSANIDNPMAVSFELGQTNMNAGIIVAYTNDVDSLWLNEELVKAVKSKMENLSSTYSTVLLFNKKKICQMLPQ